MQTLFPQVAYLELVQNFREKLQHYFEVLLAEPEGRLLELQVQVQIGENQFQGMSALIQ